MSNFEECKIDAEASTQLDNRRGYHHSDVIVEKGGFENVQLLGMQDQLDNDKNVPNQK
jgi:hypothetical protein